MFQSRFNRIPPNMLNHFMETSCPETQRRPPLAGSCLLTVCASHTDGPSEDLQKPPPLQRCSSGAEEVGSARRRWGTVSALLPLCHISSEAENSQIWDHQSGPAAESAFLYSTLLMDAADGCCRWMLTKDIHAIKKKPNPAFLCMNKRALLGCDASVFDPAVIS